MQNIIKILNDYSTYIIIGLSVITILLLILYIINIRAINKMEKKYRRLMRGVDSGNLEELITNYLDKIDEVNTQSAELREVYKDIDSRLKQCIQNVSIIRYKAFEDIGSDLSFSVALLNDNNDGIIITSIYGRNESTTYAKPIDKGISRYDLSEEEQHVLDEAINK
ncbi:MAG: DUF4446 family protein [Bacillota bacterium]|nr:DUF4446 family protein [Bacillota bacterium]